MIQTHLKLVALLLLLTIVSHDLAMAGDPHGSGTDSVSESRDATSHHHQHHSTASDQHHDQAPAEQSDPEPECGTVAEASPNRPVSLWLHAPDHHLATGPANAVDTPPVVSVRDTEPDHPPDVRRALLQVFLN